MCKHLPSLTRTSSSNYCIMYSILVEKQTLFAYIYVYVRIATHRQSYLLSTSYIFVMFRSPSGKEWTWKKTGKKIENFSNHMKNISVSGMFRICATRRLSPCFCLCFSFVCHMEMDGFLYLHHHNNISSRQSYCEANSHRHTLKKKTSNRNRKQGKVQKRHKKYTNKNVRQAKDVEEK